MRLFITIARKGESFTVVNGPEVPYLEQRESFRDLRVETNKEDYDEIQLCKLVRAKRFKFKDRMVQVVDPSFKPATKPAKNQKSAAVPTNPVSSTKPTPVKAAAAKAAAKKAEAAKAAEVKTDAGEENKQPPQSSLLD